MKPLASLIIAGCLATSIFAADLEPELGKVGKLLVDETFEKPESLKTWTHTVGDAQLEKGALRVAERSQDKHAGAFRLAVPVSDCAVQVDFRFDGANFVHLGFDPSPGELKKKGHLFSIVITPAKWLILEHGDKNDAKPKNQLLAESSTPFEQGKWYTLLLEVKGDDVVAQITGKSSLKGSSPDFHCKKPGLVLRVGGDDDKSASIDHVKVWEFK